MVWEPLTVEARVCAVLTIDTVIVAVAAAATELDIVVSVMMFSVAGETVVPINPDQEQRPFEIEDVIVGGLSSPPLTDLPVIDPLTVAYVNTLPSYAEPGLWVVRVPESVKVDGSYTVAPPLALAYGVTIESTKK